ncbi:MAG: hypothetical protein R3E83_21690 [Burkholderiaceae bacterium]
MLTTMRHAMASPPGSIDGPAMTAMWRWMTIGNGPTGGATGLLSWLIVSIVANRHRERPGSEPGPRISH